MPVLRSATPDDRDALGRLGALLVRTHHGFDRLRFLAPGADVERHYGAFLVSRVGLEDDLVRVAEVDGAVVAYAWSSVEPMSWKELRDRAGFVQDVVVDPAFRRRGLATRLVEDAAAWLATRGVPRIVLWTAARNDAARALFARLGFRETMVEMTREVPRAR